MDFFKRLFGLGGNQNMDSDGGMYYYVRLYNIPGRQSPDDEIVQVRIHASNDISKGDDGQYFVRKAVAGTRKFRRGELILYFTPDRRLLEHEVSGGELATQEEYDAYQAQFNSSVD